MKYALIGEKLSHSFSKIIHERIGGEYDLVELKEEQVESFVKNNCYDGFNVTIPYKKLVMKYLDEISPLAEMVGSVNTVVKKNGKLIGYNTDVRGLEYQIESLGVDLEKKNVLVLGSGGASNTAVALCLLKGAKSVNVVSRAGKLNYQNCYELTETEIIINATPVGMYPNVEDMPIDIDRFSNLIAVFDLIYNPIRSNLVLSAINKGLIASGGLKMLVTQGLKSRELWQGEPINEELTNKILVELTREKNNLVLSGMAGCGKTTIGKLASEYLKMPFYDVDVVITEKHGKSPAQIITEQGEQAFRDIESQVVKELSKTGGKVISLGGGSVLREENVKALKRNGIIVYLERDVEKLATENRPLSEKQGVKALFEERKQTYMKTKDVLVNNDGDVKITLKGVIEGYENSCNKWS